MASNTKIENLASQYRVLSHLGEGSVGTVKLACHLKTNALVAIKTIEITNKNIVVILSERAVLERLNHPHVIRLFQVLITTGHINFVLEYAAGGTLFDFIKENGPLHEEEAKEVFGQIVAAIKYCHNLGIAHRDIKAKNILRDEDGNVKLTDFGLAIKCRPGSLLNVRCGTRGFYAPEVVLREPYDGKKTDVWSLGVLLFYITTGYYPFTGNNVKETEKNIATGTYHIPSYFSGHLENLIHQIFTVAPERRPSIEDIEEHPWVMKCEAKIQTDAYPDCNIVDRLCGMGFNANDILESVQKKWFDEKMGTYLLLKEQVRLGIETIPTSSAKPEDPCPTLPPLPAHASTTGLPLKKSASEPSFGLLHNQPSGQQGPDALTLLSGLKVARSVSLLPMVLHCPNKSTDSTRGLRSGAMTAPCVCSTKLVDKIDEAPEPSFAVEASPPPVKIGRFKKLRNRIRDCLSRLCCFPRAPRRKTPHPSSKKVAPL
ncbi:putative sperm motility kinase W [Apodemus sylvaticus]|uniref:putative sperm motility kinase W n=1 Tax=Apodemus sylvaticus TaxID=10129 RepID=UPI002243EE12|nr:putative sperm motility kinase W [Apodemus sylvaticus]